MRRSCVFLMTVLALAMLPLPAQDKVPILAFDSMTKDFGKVTEGQILKHVFKFTNKGQVPLDVLKVEPS